MNDVIIISDHPELYSSQRLLEEITHLNLKGTFLNPFNFGFEIGHTIPDKNAPAIVLHRTTGIRHADFDLSVSLSFENQGSKICNSLASFYQLRGKEKQALFFSKYQFPFIPTFSFRGRATTERLTQIYNFFEKTGFKEEQYILKTVRGNQGIGVNLIRGKDSLASLLETFWAIQDQDFLIQPFIKIDEEYRIFSIAGKIEGALHRKPIQGEFRSNCARGEGENISTIALPEMLHELVHKLFEKSGSLYAGIDLLKRGEQFLLIEYNLVPGFHQMEQLSQKNIAKKIIEAALK